jgi:hypothetical protein
MPKTEKYNRLAMSTKTYCDRCGKIDEQIRWYQLDLKSKMFGVLQDYKGRGWHLCPTCLKELEEWMKGGK